MFQLRALTSNASYFWNFQMSKMLYACKTIFRPLLPVFIFYISKSTTIHPTKLALFGMRLNIIVQNKFKFQKQACMPQLPHVLVLPTSLLVAKYKALVIRKPGTNVGLPALLTTMVPLKHA